MRLLLEQAAVEPDEVVVAPPVLVEGAVEDEVTMPPAAVSLGTVVVPVPPVEAVGSLDWIGLVPPARDSDEVIAVVPPRCTTVSISVALPAEVLSVFAAAPP